MSTLPNIIDVEIAHKKLLDGQFVSQMANGNRYSKALIDKVMSMKEVILEKRQVREELLWFDKMKKGFNCPKSVSIKDSLVNYAKIIVDNLHDHRPLDNIPVNVAKDLICDSWLNDDLLFVILLTHNLSLLFCNIL